MKRTQIYLDEKTYRYLKKESEVKHLPISEVIRESIREKMNRKIQKMLKAADKISGMWKSRDVNVDRYVRSMRKDRKL